MFWEYLITRTSSLDSSKHVQTLFNGLGAERWEHTSSYPLYNGSGHHEFTCHSFKRRKTVRRADEGDE